MSDFELATYAWPATTYGDEARPRKGILDQRHRAVQAGIMRHHRRRHHPQPRLVARCRGVERFRDE